MLQFDINKLRSVYVYLLKVTGDYLYVTTHRNGEPYLSAAEDQVSYRDHKVTKIKIHRSVSQGFFKFNVMKEFSSPRLASLNYYGSDIIGVEIQMFNRRLGAFQAAENWQSNFSKVIVKLGDAIKDAENVWINGQEIFWVKKAEDTRSMFNITNDGSYFIQMVSYVKLSKMGLDRFQKQKTAKEISSVNTDSAEELHETVSSAYLPLSTGCVLAYKPNAAYPDLEQIVVYSPVLSADKEFGTSNKDEVRMVYSIASETNPSYPTIEFAIRAAKTIGKLYGYAETDFLDIPSIIKKTGMVNLQKISEKCRFKTPMNMRATTSISWLMGFLHRETDLNNLRDLSKMFKFIINNGLVYRNSIKTFYREGVKEHDIPLINLADFKSEIDDADLLVPNDAAEPVAA